MALRKINFIEREVFHVYNRGNFKHVIFQDKQDYERFEKILYLSNSIKRFKYKDLVKYNKSAFSVDRGENIVEVMGYVLMPNHFHIMLSGLEILPGKKRLSNKNLDNNISIFMKKVTASYSMYYNRKYNKTGSLFEGRFKAEHVEDNNYFKYLFSYIHLNPVKLIQSDWKEVGIKNFQETKKFLENYQYSSFADYFYTEIKPRGIVNKKSFLERLPQGTDLNKEIFDWLDYKTIQLN